MAEMRTKLVKHIMNTTRKRKPPQGFLVLEYFIAGEMVFELLPFERVEHQLGAIEETCTNIQNQLFPVYSN